MVTIPCCESYESDSYSSDTQDISKQQRGDPVRMAKIECNPTFAAQLVTTIGYHIVTLPLYRVLCARANSVRL